MMENDRYSCGSREENQKASWVRYLIHLLFDSVRAAYMARKLCNSDRQVILEIQYNP